MDLELLDIVLRNADFDTVQKCRGICKDWENLINKNLELYPLSIYWENGKAVAYRNKTFGPLVKELDLKYIPLCYSDILELNLKPEDYERLKMPEFYKDQLIFGPLFATGNCMKIGRSFKYLTGFGTTHAATFSLKDVLCFLVNICYLEIAAYGAVIQRADLLEMANRFFRSFEGKCYADFRLRQYHKEPLQIEDLILFLQRLEENRKKQKDHKEIDICICCPPQINYMRLKKEAERMRSARGHVFVCRYGSHDNMSRPPSGYEDWKGRNPEDFYLRIFYRVIYTSRFSR